jgi:WD40 repeat protein
MHPSTWFRRIANAIATIAMVFIPTEFVQSQDAVYFEEAIAPIFRKNCIACHNTKVAEGGLNLESVVSIMKGGDSGSAVNSQNIDASELVSRSSGAVEPIMPPDGNTVGAARLTSEQIDLIKKWIAGGALSNGRAMDKIDLSLLKLPEGARASYAVAMSPAQDFVAYGRGGSLFIHDAGRTVLPQPIDGTLAPVAAQTLANAHADFIYSIAIAPDGKTIATGSTGQVKLWKLASDPLEDNRAALEKSGVAISNVFCTSPDGNLVATAEPIAQTDPNSPADAPVATVIEIKLRDRNGAISSVLRAPETAILTAAWTPSNQRFYAVGNSNTLYAWDLAAQPIAEPTKTALPGVASSLGALDESILLLSLDRKASMWQFKTPAQAEPIADHPLLVALNASGPIDIIAMSADRSQLATSSRDDATGNTTLKQWDVPQAKLIASIDRDRSEQLALHTAERETRRAQSIVDRSKSAVDELEKAVQAEGTAVASAQAAKEKATQALTAKSQEMQTAMQGIMEHEKAMADTKAAMEAAMQKLAQLTTELEPKKKMLADIEKQKMATQMAMDNAAQALAATEETQKAAVSRLEQRKQLVASQTEKLNGAQALAAQRKSIAEAVRFSTESIAFAGKNFLIANSVKTPDQLEVFSLDSRERIETRKINVPAVPRSALAAIGTASPQRRWQQVLSIEDPTAIVDRVTALAFSPDGNKLAIGSGMPSRSGQLVVVSVSDPDIAESAARNAPTILSAFRELHSDTLLGAAFSPDGLTLATCGADKMTKLIDTQTNAVTKVFEGHTHHVLSLAWHEDGQKIATASADATVKIWDVEKGESTKTITGYGTEVTAIAYVGATPNVATSTLNNLVRIHDSNSGNQAKQFGPVGDSLYCVTISANGKYAIAAGQEGIVRVWQIEDGKLVGEWK